MKYIAFLCFLFVSTKLAAQDPGETSCPEQNNIKFESLYEAYSDTGFIVTEGDKKWMASNRDEFQSQLDPVLTKYLAQVKAWQDKGNFFAKSGKKIALAPIWAVAPKSNESPTQSFAPHLKSLIDIGLIIPQIEFVRKEADECVYDVDAVIQIKPLKIRLNFTEIPALKFREVN